MDQSFAYFISLLTGILVLVFLAAAVLAILIAVGALIWLVLKLGKSKELSKRELNKFGLVQYHEETKYQRLPSLKDSGEAKDKSGWFSGGAKPVELPQAQRPIGVITFDGDLRASKRKQVAALIDEVIVNKDKFSETVIVVNSPGGAVAEYGLLYAELERLRNQQIPLTVCIDTYGASGGYLMSVPANKIVAAPFAIVGSVGVVAFVPNIHRFLKNFDIDPRLFTAGEYKRTVTVVGEDDDRARRHFQEELESIHKHFIQSVSKYRSHAKLSVIGTGDHWTAEESMKQELGLIDELSTSRDYLLRMNRDRDLIVLSQKKNLLSEGIGMAAASIADELETRLFSRLTF